MALITRISRLFHADMNAVLDQIEQPELLLKQSIREMQEVIDQEERLFKLNQQELEQVIDKQQALKQLLVEIEEQLPICFKSEKDDLARSLIKRKLEKQEDLKALSQKQSGLEKCVRQLEDKLKEQHAQLHSMQQKADVFNDDDANFSTNYASATASVEDDDIEIAFLQEKQKWSVK